ncbi:MAG: sialidase family protein, partial [Verrucomicrobiota bacterium]|nr:sialidase family protein [Verrucomicrobiota bacterium]
MGGADLEMHKLFEGERNPNIVVAMDGTVVASWGEVENNFALGKKGIRVRRSEDGGKTWGPLITVAKPCWHGGGVTVDERSGDIFAFPEAGYPPARKWVCRSRDHGRSWHKVE